MYKIAFNSWWIMKFVFIRIVNFIIFRGVNFEFNEKKTTKKKTMITSNNIQIQENEQS
jgi:cytochrome bd-type quinol oxidase subunit 2